MRLLVTFFVNFASRRGYNATPLKNIKTFSLPIYKFGLPSIFMQFMYVVYIMILNMILAGFSDSAVTVLGLYYKLQTFFFIPLFAFQTCIVPVLSYNYAKVLTAAGKLFLIPFWLRLFLCLPAFCALNLFQKFSFESFLTARKFCKMEFLRSELSAQVFFRVFFLWWARLSFRLWATWSEAFCFL